MVRYLNFQIVLFVPSRLLCTLCRKHLQIDVSFSYLAEIFHCGVGPSRDDRIILVSIYRDGLSLVPHIDSNQPNLQFWNYKPWACRKHAKDCNEVTEQARELIYKLIDQPRNCLRCGVDKINFSEIESEDLSQSTPPGSGVNEWVLVDSKEKMHQCIQEIAVRPFTISFAGQVSSTN